MISHPLEAPSNLSDSVSSMMRLLISNRIIAAGTGIKEREGINSYTAKLTTWCQIQQFFPPLTNQSSSAGATSACHFRVLCIKDPRRWAWPWHCLRDNNLCHQCVYVTKNKCTISGLINAEFNFVVWYFKKSLYKITWFQTVKLTYNKKIILLFNSKNEGVLKITKLY